MAHHAFVFGLVGERCSGHARKIWNALLAQQRIDGFFDFYPAKTREDLELRLAEMFHLGRRAYLVSKELRPHLISLLDRYDSSVRESDIDTVINEGGVLVGYCHASLTDLQKLEVWMQKSSVTLSD